MTSILDIQNQFGQHLFNFIKGKVAATEDARDIYQDVIIKIMTKSDQIVKTESLKSWIFATANNQIIDYYRKQKPVPDSVLIDSVSADDHEEQNGYTELSKCLTGFIDQLPSEERKIFLMSEIEGQSQKDISQQLDINYVTVRSKVQRSREKIKKLLLQACEVQLSMAGVPSDCMPKSKSGSCSDQPNNKNC